jgi:hypothetical protein
LRVAVERTAEATAIVPAIHAIRAATAGKWVILKRHDDGGFLAFNGNATNDTSLLNDFELGLGSVQQTAAREGTEFASLHVRSPIKVGDISEVKVITDSTATRISLIRLQRILTKVQI